MKKKINEALIF